MYARDTSRENRSDVLIAAMRGIEFCALVSSTQNGIQATHLPVLVTHDADGRVFLEGHMSRSNAHWRTIAHGAPSVAIFQGPHAYITPSWYATKQQSGKVVPTWAYIAVHAHGELEAIMDADWLRAHVSALTDRNEADQSAPWKTSDAPDDYITTMLRGIIGIRLTVERLDGSWKLNQHRSAQDKSSTVSGLEATGDKNHAALAAEMRAACPAFLAD